MVEPQLALPGALPGGDHVVAVGGPFGGLIGARLPARDLHGVGLVERDDVDGLAAAAVRREHHARAVGAEARLPVERHALRERRGAAARDRHGVEVAQEVEDEGLPSGLTSTDIHEPSVKLVEIVRPGRSGRPSCCGWGSPSSASWAASGCGAGQRAAAPRNAARGAQRNMLRGCATITPPRERGATWFARGPGRSERIALPPIDR